MLTKILDAALLQGEYANPSRKNLVLRAVLFCVPLLVFGAWRLLA